jgi:opacity protein-like surface antigen
MKRVVFMLLGLLLLASAASAQSSSVYFPGSAWSSTGTSSNVERGNVISMNHIEQGIAIRGAEAFGLATYQVDKKGYDWNNREIYGVGARFTQTIKSGMVRVGAIYSQERRRKTDLRESGLQLVVESYFGWGRSK